MSPKVFEHPEAKADGELNVRDRLSSIAADNLRQAREIADRTTR